MSIASGCSSARSSSAPTLPDVPVHPPLALFQHPFGIDGDVSPERFTGPPEPDKETVVIVTPERFVVAEAVNDPASTRVPEAIPLVDQGPANKSSLSSSSSSSSSSSGTARAGDSGTAAAVRGSSSSDRIPLEPTLRRRATTILIEVPEASAGQRSTTTIRVIPAHTDPSEVHAPVQPANREMTRPILNTTTASAASVTSKQSKRARIRALWRRIIAKVMKKWALKQAGL